MSLRLMGVKVIIMSSQLSSLEVLEDEKVLVMYLMLHLVSKECAGGLYYHKHFDLCKLMDKYHIAYLIKKDKVWYMTKLMPFEEIFESRSRMVYQMLRWFIAERHIENLPPSKWRRLQAFMKEMEASEGVF